MSQINNRYRFLKLQNNSYLYSIITRLGMLIPIYKLILHFKIMPKI